jgi:hypothetical protein
VVQNRRGGRWRGLVTRALRTRSGRFRTSFVPARSGSYRFYVVAKTDSVSERGRTDIRLLRVGRTSGGAPAGR